MAGFSAYLSGKIIDYTLRGQSFSMPSSLYLAVFTADPTDANVTANEVSAGWYARQSTGTWAAGTGTTAIVTSNNNQIQFPAVTGTAVTVTYWGIYDASTSGNLLYSGALSSSKTLNVGDILTVAANALQITVD